MLEPQNVQAAMARGELSEAEAYFVLRFAGRHGYNKAMARMDFSRLPLLRRARKWFVWFGGWEVPELSQWDSGRSAWEIRKGGRWRDPFPLSLFGHRVTFFSGWFEYRWRGVRHVVKRGAQGWRHVNADAE